MMTGTQFERLVEGFLAAAAPASIPEHLHPAIVAGARRTRQRRALGVPGRRTLIANARLAIDLAAVVVLAVSAFNVMAPRAPGVGAPGTPAVSTQPSRSTGPGTTPRVFSPGESEVDPVGADYYYGRHTLTVDGIRFSFLVDAPRWEPYDGFSISKSFRGPQGAEAVIFWAGFPGGERAAECLTMASPVGLQPSLVAAAIAAADGVAVVAEPSQVTIAGRPATFVAVTIREDVGCDPGFFYSWKAKTGGALWVRTVPGDSIRVWVVDVDGRLLVIGALTSGKAPAAVMPRLEQEVDDIVASITFE